MMLPSTSTSWNFRDVPSTDILHACAGIMLELFLSRGDAVIDVVYFLRLVQESRRRSSCLEALVVVGWKLLVGHVPSATSNAGIQFGPGPARFIQFYRLTPRNWLRHDQSEKLSSQASSTKSLFYISKSSNWLK